MSPGQRLLGVIADLDECVEGLADAIAVHREVLCEPDTLAQIPPDADVYASLQRLTVAAQTALATLTAGRDTTRLYLARGATL